MITFDSYTLTQFFQRIWLRGVYFVGPTKSNLRGINWRCQFSNSVFRKWAKFCWNISWPSSCRLSFSTMSDNVRSTVSLSNLQSSKCITSVNLPRKKPVQTRWPLSPNFTFVGVAYVLNVILLDWHQLSSENYVRRLTVPFRQKLHLFEKWMFERKFGSCVIHSLIFLQKFQQRSKSSSYSFWISVTL